MPNILVSIIVSACLGALVGLIRQWSDQSAPNGSGDFGGVRTYSFWAMLGCLGALLGEKAAPALLTATLVMVAVAGEGVCAVHVVPSGDVITWAVVPTDPTATNSPLP